MLFSQLTRSLLLALPLSASYVGAQSVEFMVFFRGESWLQEDPTQLQLFPFDPAYKADLEFVTLTGDFTGLNVVLPDSSSQDFVDGELVVEYEELSALSAAWPAGSYSFAGQGSEFGAFSIPFTAPEFTPLEPIRFTNYQALKTIDPSAEVTLTWNPLPIGADFALLQLRVGYPMEDGSYVSESWEAPSERADGVPGLEPNRTSYAIPAGALTGSDTGRYDVTLEYTLADPQENVGPFAGALFLVGTTTSTMVQLVEGEAPVSELYLGVWTTYEPFWADTGDWLGWLWIESHPWVYSSAFSGYLYVEESSVDPAAGGWIYAPAR